MSSYVYVIKFQSIQSRRIPIDDFIAEIAARGGYQTRNMDHNCFFDIKM